MGRNVRDIKYDTKLSNSYILTQATEQRTLVHVYTRILPSMSSYRRYLICVSMAGEEGKVSSPSSGEQRCRYELPLKETVCQAS